MEQDDDGDADDDEEEEGALSVWDIGLRQYTVAHADTSAYMLADKRWSIGPAENITLCVSVSVFFFKLVFFAL